MLMMMENDRAKRNNVGKIGGRRLLTLRCFRTSPRGFSDKDELGHTLALANESAGCTLTSQLTTIG